MTEPEFEHYTGDAPCHHGRRVGDDAPHVEECPRPAQRVARDDSDEFRLCEKHYQNFLINLRFGGLAGDSRD